MGDHAISRAIVVWDAGRIIYTNRGIIEWSGRREKPRRYRQRHPVFPAILLLDTTHGDSGGSTSDPTVESRPQDDRLVDQG